MESQNCLVPHFTPLFGADNSSLAFSVTPCSPAGAKDPGIRHICYTCIWHLLADVQKDGGCTMA